MPAATIRLQGAALEWPPGGFVTYIRRFARGAFGCSGPGIEQAAYAGYVLPHCFQDDPAGRLAQGSLAGTRDRQSLGLA